MDVVVASFSRETSLYFQVSDVNSTRKAKFYGFDYRTIRDTRAELVSFFSIGLR